MSKRAGQAQIMSANGLLDGAVIYYAPGGSWSSSLADALVAVTEAEASALETARAAAEARGDVVEPEILPVESDAAGRLVPSHYREKIRALGPTIRTDLGRRRPGSTFMYRYDEFDEAVVRERVAQFREQVARRLDGSLTEDEFKPLRLKNGLYLQLHAYMLRIAVPYGTLQRRQLRQLALIADSYDRGYGHFTTRQNLQFNWPKLSDVPDILDALADVEMHCIQTSGNCIRNVTADHFAGVAADEIEDPRPTAELIRQWSTLHPEFSFLPRKFKIAVTGAARDRAAIARPRHRPAHACGTRPARSATRSSSAAASAGRR